MYVYNIQICKILISCTFKHWIYSVIKSINIDCFIFRSIYSRKIELLPLVLCKHCMEIDLLMFNIIFRIIIIILYLTKLQFTNQTVNKCNCIYS